MSRGLKIPGQGIHMSSLSHAALPSDTWIDPDTKMGIANLRVSGPSIVAQLTGRAALPHVDGLGD